MGSGARYLTPTLFVGTSASHDCTPAASVEEALRIIHHHKAALVPTDEIAVEVMRALGLDEATIADRMYFSYTGRTLLK